MGEVLGIREIKAILPQRYPMLMLDRAEQISDTRFVGLKNLSINENFFQGHFPGHAIMPGVLQLEAMKQLGELAVRPQLDPAGEFDVYMRVVEKVKFRRPNNPGDRARIEVEVVSVENELSGMGAICDLPSICRLLTKTPSLKINSIKGDWSHCFSISHHLSSLQEKMVFCAGAGNASLTYNVSFTHEAAMTPRGLSLPSVSAAEL